MKRNVFNLFLAVLIVSTTTYAQRTESKIKKYLKASQEALELSDDDISNWVIYDQHTDQRLGLTYAYIRQMHKGLEVYNATGTFAINDKKVLFTGNSLVKDVAGKVNTTQAKVAAGDALVAAERFIGIETPEIPAILESGKNEFLFDRGTVSLENIPAKLVLVPAEGKVRLAWDFSIYQLDAQHWWSIRIDALTGEEIDRADWVAHCQFDTHDHPAGTVCQSMEGTNEVTPLLLPTPPPSTDQYNVFPLPVESPNHGGRALVVGPYDPVTSPYGWHDDNGASGAEYTITRGNNVYAYEDAGDNNAPGYSPDGGASLNFDFPLNMNQAANNYYDAAITNLFYMNNMMHDIWYHYGFDEASGNFQENNYGNGGAASDGVNAEAQDGGGMNNANFATPGDGSNPRMQMYLWTNPGPQLLTVNAPGTLAGGYTAVQAGFGPAVPASPLTSDLVIYNDATPDEYDACEVAVNGATMSGKIVLIRRGSCTFVDKVTRAQNEGAIAVIMVNNVAGAPIVMGGTGPGVTIPSVMVSDVDGEALIAEIEAGGTVNATLQDAPAFDLDGDFDNGIIAHEYGHGISNRLTGGASNSNCLSNAEQMGEGWSDWFAIVMTMEPGDVSTDNRGMGTFVTGESVNGVGIRPAPYTTDMAVNGYTYDATNNTGAISQPHGIGFVWCTMLWDLTWDLIDLYGYDPDLHTGTGGNNIAMNLVIQGIKLQPCGPGFVDGRDAILQADQLLYGGMHECLIWNAFASRGLGYSASQGSANNRSDQVEAFDLPPWLINVSGSESISTCGSYTWAANGQTYTSSGTYTETLIASSGCDSTATLNLTITPAYASAETVVNCGSYTWAANGQTYASSGTYSETLTAQNGCDSTITLDLTVALPTSGTDVVSACGSYTWIDGNTYTSNNNTATYTLTNAQGCDSIVTLDLTIATPTAGTDVISACGSYLWIDGNTYTSNNNAATFTLTNAQGCDSVVTLDLTINNPTVGTDVQSACGSYIWIDGNTYTSNNNSATYVLTNAQGCDSVVTLDLTINNATAGTDVISACQSYTWIDGNTYTSNNNSATYMLTNASGCDSLVTLDLTISPVYNETEIVNSCTAYTWAANGQIYNSSGQYVANLTSSNGCDSTVTLDLTISNVSNTTETVNTCGSYTWPVNGVTYSAGGIYSETLTAQSGCDSIVNLDLTISQPSMATQNATSCGSYTWSANGQTYTTSGSYTTVLTNALGCDSIVTLDLMISQDSPVTTQAVTACESYTWPTTGNTYTSGGQYTASLQNAGGCDSTIILDLIINNNYAYTENVNSCGNYTWSVTGLTYSSSGVYTVNMSTSNGCDSTLTLDLTIDNLVATASFVDDVTLTADQNGAAYQWIDCDNDFSEIQGATSQTYAPAANGNYAVVVTSAGCSDTSECLTVSDVGIDVFASGAGLNVYPNPTNGELFVDLGADLSGVQVKLMNALGQVVREQYHTSGQIIEMRIDEAPGAYVLELVTKEGNTSRIKVIKEH